MYHCTALSILWFPSARLELGPILKRDFLYGWSLPYKLSKVWPISAQRKFSVQSLYWARSRNIYVLYWRTFIIQIAVLIKSWTKDSFWQILERFCWQSGKFLDTFKLNPMRSCSLLIWILSAVIIFANLAPTCYGLKNEFRK